MNYTTEELMIVAASKQLDDEEVVFVGTGLPMLACLVAKATHAPNLFMLFESGIIDPKPSHLAKGVGDFRLLKGATKRTSLNYVLTLLQGGYIDVGFLGAAEVDQYGNINSTFIGGNYTAPKLRLPGSGGANDIASNAKRTLVIMPHQKRKFKRNLSYLTTPGFLTGGDSRAQAGLIGGGPSRVITDKAILDFEPISKKMRLLAVHPGVTTEEVQELTEFELLISDDISVTTEPTEEELSIIRELDKEGIYVNKNLA
ncbi:CoA-transferase [Alkalihalobacillus oceani]|uniref:CoA-transferase subunit beta n=1 Tax=Halalkalibacter oceani TaxID=1653776 RepID=UPI00203BB852|nr:CoA-transferase [Halalkalibacter oceani]MCM3759904.1 CoA-transferase [Halalkalibacter oceani]